MRNAEVAENAGLTKPPGLLKLAGGHLKPLYERENFSVASLEVRFQNRILGELSSDKQVFEFRIVFGAVLKEIHVSFSLKAT